MPTSKNFQCVDSLPPNHCYIQRDPSGLGGGAWGVAYVTNRLLTGTPPGGSEARWSFSWEEDRGGGAWGGGAGRRRRPPSAVGGDVRGAAAVAVGGLRSLDVQVQ